MYNLGSGVAQDYVQAHVWLNLAALRLVPDDARDRALTERNGVASRMLGHA